MYFCDVCNHLLTDKVTETKIYYECTVCKKTFNVSPEDTLRFEQVFHNKSKTRKGAFMYTAAFDVSNPKVFKDCPKCSKSIVTSVVEGDDMVFTYLCTCGHTFQ